LCCDTRRAKENKMAKRIAATDYVTLDGVMQDPVGMENSGLGNWTRPFSPWPAQRVAMGALRGSRINPAAARNR
jgi:hypothetical protein